MRLMHCGRAVGAPLFTLELEKSVQEVTAPVSGTLRIKAEAGQVYQMGDLLGEIY
jgi:pyruvate/2-oxoglutarate dehydrogenase complex dihydrolipoamide acyltransferase (E2) component